MADYIRDLLSMHEDLVKGQMTREKVRLVCGSEIRMLAQSQHLDAPHGLTEHKLAEHLVTNEFEGFEKFHEAMELLNRREALKVVFYPNGRPKGSKV